MYKHNATQIYKEVLLNPNEVIDSNKITVGIKCPTIIHAQIIQKENSINLFQN